MNPRPSYQEDPDTVTTFVDPTADNLSPITEDPDIARLAFSLDKKTRRPVRPGLVEDVYEPDGMANGQVVKENRGVSFADEVISSNSSDDDQPSGSSGSHIVEIHDSPTSSEGGPSGVYHF